MVEYLKYIKEFLRHERGEYGFPPYGLDFSFDNKAFYGMIEDDLGICDNNSFYLLYDFNKKNLSKPAFKPALNIGNMGDFYDDMLSYLSQYDLKDLDEDIVNIINKNQMRFYQGFLGEETTVHITDSGILVGESPKGQAYIYTNNGKIDI